MSWVSGGGGGGSTTYAGLTDVALTSLVADQIPVFNGTSWINDYSNVKIITDATTARTLTASDNNKILRFTNSSNITVTLANGLATNFSTTIVKAGTGNVIIVAAGTLTPSTGTTIEIQTAAAVVYHLGSNAWEAMGSFGPAAATGIVALSDATDANFTMSVNARKYLPSATLTTNRTITIPTGSEGDIMKFFSNETGFMWNLTGGAIYKSDGVTTISSLSANTNYLIEKVSGKWRILN